MNNKLAELTDEELEQVNGGTSDILLGYIRKLIAKFPDIDEARYAILKKSGKTAIKNLTSKIF